MFSEFTDADILRKLLLALRWNVILSLTAFVGGGLLTLILTFARLYIRGPAEMAVRFYVNVFQGTPVLMQLFLCFFAFPLIGIEVSPWVAASICLTLYASAFLLDIWQGAIAALPRGQWEACRVLGLSFTQTLFRVILPQAFRTALGPTVGFLVQVEKNTALASIIGFAEMTKVATMMINATFQPFKIYGLTAALYFAICFPLSLLARRIERKMKCRS